MDKKVRNWTKFLGIALAPLEARFLRVFKVFIVLLLTGFACIIFTNNAQAYANTSTSTSAVIQIYDVSYGSYPKLGTFSWSETKPGNTFVTFRVRAGNVLVPDGTWSAWTSTANGGSLSAFNGNKYIQYEATLSSDDISIVPMVNDISVTYGGPFTLISSPYNTTASTSTLNSMTWTETLPGTSDAIFQVRTSPDNSTWTSWMGPDGTSASFFTDPAGGESMPAGLRDGASDQWIQYKMFLLSDLTNSPTVSQVQMNYNSLVPVISSFSVTPNTGNTTKIYDIPYATETMTINGSDFVTGATVTLIKGATNVSATSVNVVSANQITCQFNSSQTAYGNWDLKVTNANGASVTSTAALESVNVVPAITSISASPNNGNPAQIDGTDVGNVTLTVNGSSFVTGATVKIVNTVTAAEVSLTGVNVASSSLITATLDPTLAWGGTWSVVVTNINSATGTLAGGLMIIHKSISTSAVLDLTEGKDFSTITWTDSTPSGTSTALEIRAGNTNDGSFSGWTSWTAVTKNQDLGTSIDGNRYVQYRATLRASNINNVSSIQDITLSYVYYPTGSFQLLGSPYNAGASDNILASIQWAETVSAGATDVKFQIRTAPDNGSGAPNWAGGSKWCGPTSCAATTGDTDYAASWYNSVPAGENVNAVQSNGSGDQWMQYSAWLDTNNAGQTPVMSQVQMNYAVNSQPTVSAVTASQNADGTISIGYTLADNDSVGSDETVSASADIGVTFTDNPLTVGASTINLAGNYANLPTGAQTIIIESEQITCTSRSGAVLSCVGGRGANHTTAVQHTQSGSTIVWAKALTTAPGDNIGAGQSVGSGKHITWTIKSDFDGVYNATGKIRVTANDGNIANQVGNGDSSTFVIDTKNPASPQITANRSETTNQIKIAVSDDTAAGISYALNYPTADIYGNYGDCDFSSPSWTSLTANPLTENLTDNNDDVRKVCVAFKDAYNNISSNSTNFAITPQNPYAFKYYDTSNPELDDYRVFLSWGIPEDTAEGKEGGANGFDYYEIYSCSDDKEDSACTPDTQLDTVGPDKTVNYFTHANLDETQRYCYKYRLKDTNPDNTNIGDFSKWSETLCVVPGSGTSSLTKNLSIHWYADSDDNVPSDQIYTTQATIRWQTVNASDPDEALLSDSTVYWRELGTSGWPYSYYVSSYVENHQITIPGELEPDTIYEYQVASETPWNTSDTSQGTTPATFHTKSGPVIQNVATSEVGNNTANITWDTVDENEDPQNSSSVVYYSDSLNADGSLHNAQTGSCTAGYISHHTCTLSGLDDGTQHYYYVYSAEEPPADGYSADTNGGSFYRFTTTTDTTAPEITPDTNPLILTDTQAAIAWGTNERAKSWIIYGEGTHATGYTAPTLDFDPENNSHNPYSDYIANGNSNLSHTFVMELDSLTPDTEYFYRLVSQDTSGNVTVSGQDTFRTLQVQVEHTPLVDATHASVLTIAQYSDTEAVVTFNAGTTTTSKLCYATSSGIDIENCVGETAITNSKIHTYHLSGLTPSTPYFVKMKLTDSDDALDTFVPDEKTFTTEAIQVDHIALADATHDTDPTVIMKTDTEADLYFNAGTTTTSKLCYDTAGSIDIATCTGETPITNSKIHTYHLQGLDPDQKYYVKMKLTDSDNAGDTYVTGEINFTMLELQEPHHALTNPGDPIVDSYSDTEAVVHLPAANTESTSKLCYGTAAIADGSVATCPNHADVTDETMTHYYVLSGLTPDTTYHLKSKITDADNPGISFYSTSAPGDITFHTKKIQVDQHTALTTISTPGSGDITKSWNYAFVSWTTNQAADSAISCTDPEAGTHLASSDSLNIQHTLKLGGLDSNTLYICTVISEDDLNNSLTSGEFTFTTEKEAEFQHGALTSISNVAESIVTDTNAAITFDTDQGALCLAEVTTSSGNYTNPAIYQEDGYTQNEKFNSSHTIYLTDLLFSTPYYYRVTCHDNLGTIVTQQDDDNQTFTTLLQQSDHPVLSGIGALDVPQYSDTEALVTLPAVNTQSTSKLCYATTDNINIDTCSGATITTPTLTHYYHLTGLTAKTHYYLKIKVTDSTNSSISFTATTDFTTSETPVDHPDLTDPGNPGTLQISDTEATITLPAKTDEDEVSTNSTATSKLCWGESEITDVSNCANHQEIASPTRLHYYHLTGLTPNTTYHIRTKATDAVHTNVEFTSEDVTFITSEQLYTASGADALGDHTAPVISNVSTGTITGESVTVKWDTDEESSSNVKFGIKSGTYDNEAGNSDVNSDTANYVTAHEVILNNLVPGTKYYFIARSIDPSGNIGESDESSFTTKSASGLGSIEIISTKLGEATITWKTSEKTTSVVEYGISDIYGENKESKTLTLTHEISITGLKQNIKYHLRVGGKDANNNLYTSGDYTFTPKSPPSITNVKLASSTEHEAVIAFTTSVATDALITYANTADDKDTGSQGNPTLTTNHELTLKNLTAGVTYSYTITAKDIDGNSTASPAAGESSRTLTTGKDENPPKIDQVRTDSALAQNDKVQTIISWITDELSNTALIYKEGQNAESREVKISDVSTTSHIAVITIFKPGTVYYFKVKSTDLSQNSATSGDFALLTPKRKENIVQIIISNFQEIFSWARF